TLSILVVREKIWHFVTEHGQATWFQHYNRNTAGELRTQGEQNLFKEPLSSIQHSKIIEWAATTEGFLWNGNSKACGFKDDGRGLRSLGKEVVIESVRPEDDFGYARLWRASSTRDACVPKKPFLKSPSCKLWNLPLLWHASKC